MTESWGQPPQQGWGQQPPPQQQYAPPTPPQQWQQPPAQQQGWGQQPPPQQQGWGAPQQQPAQQQPIGQPTQSVEDFFNEAGGGPGAPSFKFQNQPGHAVYGVITDQRVVYKTKPAGPGRNPEVAYDRNGKPLTQVELTLQTNLRNWQDVSKVPTTTLEGGQIVQLGPEHDTGLRRIYLWYTLRDAVITALKAVGLTQTAVGDTIGVKVDHTEPNPQGGSDIRKYEAVYRPAGAPASPPQAPPSAPPVQQQYAPPPQQQMAPPPPQMPPASPFGQAPQGQPPQQWPTPPTGGGYPDQPPF